MKKLAALAILSLGLIFYIGCEVDTPAQPELSIPQEQLVLSKVIALGNSLTAGFQSAGMREDFQLKSYPYLIAQQIGKGTGFEQPLIASPGIGSTSGKCPLEIQNGLIVAPDLGVDPRTLLKNSLLARPYDNLGVPGATLGDMVGAYDSKSSASGSNPFFDMILRNPNFGNTTQLQQAILLNPTLILLWIGNNDVLAAALNGGNAAFITSQSDFQTRYTRLLTELRQKTHAAIVMANIPYVTDIPYINTLDGIFRTIPALGINQPVPVVFDQSFQPVVFPGGLNLPLLTAETGVAHLTLPALSAYQTGMGIPNEAVLTAMGMSADIAAQLVAGMRAAGLNPTGTPIPGNLTITVQEGDAIRQAVEGFNQILQGLAGTFKVPLVDMNSALTTLNLSGLEGCSGKFVLLDPAHTAFSLDAVHPSSAGYAIVANAFIDKINAAFQLAIPKVNVHALSGQYSSASQQIALEAVEQVKAIF